MIRKLFLILTITAALLAGPGQSAYDTGGVTKTILSNGLTILARSEPDAKVVAIEIFVRVGAADENKLNTGIGQLLAGSILAGNESHSATKLARLVSEVGGNFHALWQWNYLEIYAVTPPETCVETLGLLAETIQNSKLDPASVEYSRSAILKESQRQEDDPFNCAYTALRRSVHRETAYDRPFLGNPAKVKIISPKQLKEFYKKSFSPDRIVISVVGNIDPQLMTRKIEIYFGNMVRQRGQPASVEPSTFRAAEELSIKKPSPAAYIMLGYPAAGVDDPDYPAMCAVNVLLGGSKSSLLFTKLREERGLGYQVGSLYPTLRGGSHIVAYLGMDSARATPESLKIVKEAMLEQVEILRSGGFAEDDLERAKSYLIGHHALKHERTRDRAYYLGWHETIGLGYQYDFQYADKIKRVTKGDVQRVCARFLDIPVVIILSGNGTLDPLNP